MILADDNTLSRILGVALDACARMGRVHVSDVVAVTGYAEADCLFALIQLVRRGDLVARHGNCFARPLCRALRLPGASWPTDLRAPVAALMGAR